MAVVVVAVGTAAGMDIAMMLVRALRKKKRKVLHRQKTRIRQTHSPMPRCPHLALPAHLTHLIRRTTHPPLRNHPLMLLLIPITAVLGLSLTRRSRPMTSWTLIYLILTSGWLFQLKRSWRMAGICTILALVIICAPIERISLPLM